MFTPMMEELIRSAAAAPFSVKSTDIQPMVDPEEAHVRICLQLEEADDIEWSAMGFLFALASLSFHDARPRGYSEKQFEADDVFLVDDFLPTVKLTKRGLEWYGDYVKGRRMKTRLQVMNDGHIMIETTERGEAATRWVARLQGKTTIQAVSARG